jgi:hypothetical protein
MPQGYSATALLRNLRGLVSSRFARREDRRVADANSTGSAEGTATVTPLRRRTVAVRLSDAEFTAWEQACLAAGRRQLGAWVREVAVAGYLAGPRTPHIAEADPAVAGLRGELARIGSNINQIAAALNQPTHPHHEQARMDAARVMGELTPVVGALYESLNAAGERR